MRGVMLALGFALPYSAEESFVAPREDAMEEVSTVVESLAGNGFDEVGVEMEGLLSSRSGLNEGSDVWLMWKGASRRTSTVGVGDSFQVVAAGEPTDVLLRWSAVPTSRGSATTSSLKIGSSGFGGELMDLE